NFGIVTSFEFDLHKLGPQVLAGPVVHDFRDAPGVLRQVDDTLQYAPKEVSCLAILRHAPPLPFIPEPMHGKMILLLALIHAGDPVHGEAALAPFRTIGKPVADRVAPRPYTAFQSQFDASASQGARNYWKAHYLQDLDDEGIETLCVQAARMTSKESVIGMLTMGGAVAEQPPESTPYTHRDATWALNIQSRWREPDEDDHHIGWCREAFEAMKPFATGGVYVNFLSGGEGDARLRAAYGDRTYQRLAEVKRTWDPENLFHLNQNIQP
ncbi:MAG TPA: BBE domain-containing protein, partial [Gammaproteobacteria bacterium]|nr:BBE domain-containing protein [Gammaproteobacteria bacterium]